jgi:hypothetical protein
MTFCIPRAKAQQAAGVLRAHLLGKRRAPLH